MVKGRNTQTPKRINTKKLKAGELTGVALDGAIRFVIAKQKKSNNKAIVNEVAKVLKVRVSPTRVKEVRLGVKIKNKAPPGRKKQSAAKKKRNAVIKLVEEAVEHRTIRHDGTETYTNATSTHIAAHIRKKGTKAPSASTIRSHLKTLGYACRRRPSRCHNGSASDKATRLAFAQKWEKNLATLAARQGMIFSDEHNLSTNHSGFRYAWVKDGTQTIDMLPVDKADWRNVPHVQVFGAIGVGWRSPLVDVSNPGGKRMTAEQYKEKCIRAISSFAKKPGKKFVQDGAPCHRTKEVKKFIGEQGMDLLEGWPARSPDLNPIEDVWSLLDKKIQDLHPEGTHEADELLRWAQDAWKQLDKKVLDNLVLGFRGRLEKCVKTKGDIVKA